MTDVEQRLASGRRARRRVEMHTRVLESAVELFVERGYDATTMDAIADRADVARATVYNHFTHKVGILEAWGARRRAQVGEMLAGAPEERSTEEKLRAYLRGLVDLNVASRRETAVLMDASDRFGGLLRTPSLDLEFSRILSEGQASGQVKTDVDVAQAGELLAAGYFTSVLRWINTDPAEPDHEPFALLDHVDQMLDIILRGLLC